MAVRSNPASTWIPESTDARKPSASVVSMTSLPPGVLALNETARPRTISRAKPLQGISANFRRFPPFRARVEKAAIS